MTINVKLDDGAYMPERAHKADAGYDLRTRERVVLRKHDYIEIDTGVHIAIPNGYYGKLESKSGLNMKHNIMCTGGVIDSEYTGSIRVKLYNFGGSHYIFDAGDKIVQLIFHQFAAPNLTETLSLKETERGDNGFGSTGK